MDQFERRWGVAQSHDAGSLEAAHTARWILKWRNGLQPGNRHTPIEDQDRLPAFHPIEEGTQAVAGLGNGGGTHGASIAFS